MENKIEILDEKYDGSIGIGQLYQAEHQGIYILAAIPVTDSRRAILINLINGGHWGKGAEVEILGDITITEFEKITGEGNFKRIHKINITSED